MASHLDLEEQEQLDQLKAFWNRYGNLITAVLVIVVGAYLAWLGWNAWQRDQGAKAGSMYDELERAAQGGDAAQTGRIFDDIKARFPRTAFAAQAGMLAAKVAAAKGQGDAARAQLAWVADNGADPAYRSIARLRLAGLLLDDRKFDEALRQLDGIDAGEFAALAADRRGDVLLAQGKADEARGAYRKAWDAMDAKVDYRRVVEAKLDVLGASPVAPAASEVAPVVATPAPSAAPGASAGSTATMAPGSAAASAAESPR